MCPRRRGRYSRLPQGQTSGRNRWQGFPSSPTELAKSIEPTSVTASKSVYYQQPIHHPLHGCLGCCLFQDQRLVLVRSLSRPPPPLVWTLSDIICITSSLSSSLHPYLLLFPGNALFMYKGSHDSAPAETLALIGWNVEFVDVAVEKGARRAWLVNGMTHINNETTCSSSLFAFVHQ